MAIVNDLGQNWDLVSDVLSSSSQIKVHNLKFLLVRSRDIALYLHICQPFEQSKVSTVVYLKEFLFNILNA